MATTWGKMMSAPGDIVSGAMNVTGKAIKYTIYGAVVCGIAVMLNQFAHNAFGIDNYASKAVEFIGDKLGGAFEWAVNGIGSLFKFKEIMTPGTISGFIGTAATDSDVATGAIKTVEGWATSVGTSVGGYFTANGAKDTVVEANKATANAVLAAGGTAAVVGTTVGKWQAAEDQRRAARAQAMQQLA